MVSCAVKQSDCRMQQLYFLWISGLCISQWSSLPSWTYPGPRSRLFHGSFLGSHCCVSDDEAGWFMDCTLLHAQKKAWTYVCDAVFSQLHSSTKPLHVYIGQSNIIMIMQTVLNVHVASALTTLTNHNRRFDDPVPYRLVWLQKFEINNNMYTWRDIWITDLYMNKYTPRFHAISGLSLGPWVCRQWIDCLVGAERVNLDLRRSAVQASTPSVSLEALLHLPATWLDHWPLWIIHSLEDEQYSASQLWCHL